QALLAGFFIVLCNTSPKAIILLQMPLSSLLKRVLRRFGCQTLMIEFGISSPGLSNFNLLNELKKQICSSSTYFRFALASNLSGNGSCLSGENKKAAKG